MPTTVRYEDAHDLKVRVPGAMRAELDALAMQHDLSLAGAVRLVLCAGLPAVLAPRNTDPGDVGERLASLDSWLLNHEERIARLEREREHRR